MTTKRVIVIGAGAGGMMAACRAAEMGADVLLLEKTLCPGNKILLTANRRCNLSNTRELDDFIAMYGPNGRFLYHAFRHYFREDLLAFLKHYGVETKIEGDGRVFPASEDAQDVVRAFERCMADHSVRLAKNIRVESILLDKGRVTGVKAGDEVYPTTTVILATGGSSYPQTGSSGDGYRLASAIGHTITALRPALIPLIVFETQRAKSMQGVSLSNVRLTAYQCPADAIDPSLTPTSDRGRGISGKQPAIPIIESRRGEMMITHFGISGPMVLLMSLAIVDALQNGPVSVSIDLFPDLNERQMRQRLQSEFDRYGKRGFRHLLDGLLPNKMVAPFIDMAAIPPEKRSHEIDAEERERLLSLLKSLRFNIKGPLSIAAAMVTAGGVSLKEIDPRTMGSRLVDGLYFCGEVMDLDGDTGGYNLQAAFSTGYVAGEEAARS
ncbi:MAG: NAD(P)/FAD-dependent oxidoreductase [Dehalococcoidia bacterium]|nr:NAD(P)/FAD-dependent oxidoreductase [Dehalococcoidia bacterium]